MSEKKNIPERGSAPNADEKFLLVDNVRSLVLGSLLLATISACEAKSCTAVTLGPVPLLIPQEHLTRTTSRNGKYANFLFAFDSTIPGIKCDSGCSDLFVYVSSIGPTPEQIWKNLRPTPTAQITGNYQVFLSWSDVGKQRPLREILVPKGAVNPHEEFYDCVPDGRVINPGCQIAVVAKNGLIAQFSIQRKVLGRAREAARFVMQTIDQFSENHSKGKCE